MEGKGWHVDSGPGFPLCLIKTSSLSIAAVWIWGMLLVGGTFIYASTGRMFRALTTGTVADPPADMVAPSPDDLVAMADAGAGPLAVVSGSMVVPGSNSEIRPGFYVCPDEDQQSIFLDLPCP
mgnify:CR=1 FL=1